MFTKQEIVEAFTPVPKLNEVQKTCILKLEKTFIDVATDIEDLVPVSADRTAALRKLLEVKWSCVQAITHPVKAKPETAKSK